jgi:predicted enzyme related to lactoylglutathione lyase
VAGKAPPKGIDAGYYAVMEDTQKNTFGIWQDK